MVCYYYPGDFMKPYIRAHKHHTDSPDPTLFRKHTHDDYEIFCFIAGDARYFVEGNIYDLKPKDILIIKKSESHALLINKATPYTRYVINFCPSALSDDRANQLIPIIDEKPLGTANSIQGTEEQKDRWIYYLDSIVGAKSFGEKRLYLTALLSELCKNIDKSSYSDYSSTANGRLIEYINHNLLTISNLDDICRHFYISKTHLNRKFKAMTGTTAWDYILSKRLIIAKDMLASGMRPVDVSEKCGYDEYSSFYRAYKAHFGVSPKNYMEK